MLHLSDIHIRENNNPILERYEKIGATLLTELPEASALFIIITGDIAFSGSKLEYEQATLFLNNLIKYIKGKFVKPVYVIMTPGNHDGEFKKAGNGRLAIIDKVREKGELYIDDEVISQCTAPQKNYFEFESQLSSEGLIINETLWKEYQFHIEDMVIGFSSINASWMSQIPEEPGKLVFPVKRYSTANSSNASINIILFHHPLNWYAQGTYHPLRDLCRANYQIIMSGHEHTHSSTITSDNANNQTINLEAGALGPEDIEKSTFSIIKIDLIKKRFAQEIFKWHETMYLPANGIAVWDAFMPLPEGKSNAFNITEEMQLRLERLGASFSHPELDALSLSDVFVYPDLLELDEEDGTNEAVSSDVFPRQLDTMGKVLIYGDDQFGKTSLLLHLFQQYHLAGYAPIFLDAQVLGGATEDQFARIINNHVAEQYGNSSVNRFEQTDINKKIALVDNIDKLGKRGDVLARVVNYLNKHFGYIFLTAGERFDLTVLSSVEASTATKAFNTFRMLGFGYKLRNELIRRWYKAGSEIPAIELQEKVHSAEQLINSILGKGLVPMTAFNVLVLLQTIEVNQKGILANAGMAQYYEFLIRKSLIDIKVKSDEIDEFISYLSHLAWFMYKQKTKSIQEQEFTEFNIEFSNDIHKTSFSLRLSILEKSKILLKKDDGYYFAYSYLGYFFVAKYIANNLEDNQELKEKVIHICKHLYIRENANIILFLTHHSNSKWILKEVAGVLNELLSEIIPLDIVKDSSILNSWISEKARIAIDTTDHERNQKTTRGKDDNAEKYQEHEQTVELNSVKELDEVLQLNLLFKTSEILGQIIKSRYGSMNKETKAELLKDLFNAPLRAINFFLILINKEPEVLISEITSRIQSKIPAVDKNKADAAAKKFVFAIFGAVADSFLSRQGEIIGTPKLLDSIQQVAKENGGLTYQFISIAAQLSYPNHAPIEDIKNLAKEMESNYFGYKILQGLAARHMYMYSLPPQERQALSNAVGIDIHGQRDIERKSTDVKRIPNKLYKLNHPKSLMAQITDSIVKNESVKKTLERYLKIPKKQKDN